MTTIIVDHDTKGWTMETMPQLVLAEPGRAEWTDVPVPSLTGDNDALVEPLAVATCDLDT
jgi:hypothetical protein